MTTKPENIDSKYKAIISNLKTNKKRILKCILREILKENQSDKKTTFLKLTPDSKEKNHDTYTSALDFAFNDREIKNIALTGPYGSGKTTIWTYYVKQKEADDEAFKNIISVALGKYDCALNTSDKIADKDNPDKLTQAEENRLEKQLIQQIAAQIPSKKIPLSKFKAKENKSRLALVTTTFTLLLIASVFLWFGRNSVLLNNFFLNSGFSLFYAKTIFYTLISIAFFSTSGCFIYRFLNNYQLHFSKIAFYGTEANLSEADDFKESVFDQELKEIVYLLKQSGAKIIVFEDIDRYDDLSLFTKLRELNFILNKNLEVNGKDYPIRFIYLLKDSLLESKTRTKFFDFIIPVVPVITAHNSEDKLSFLLEKVGMKGCLSDSFIFNVSLYIDDMRLLKNIVNEFKLYKDLINLNLKENSSEEDKKEAHNKLFSILLIKNIFPNEFDALQAKRGYFKTLFHTIEQHKKIYQGEKYALLEKEQKDRILNDLITWAKKENENKEENNKTIVNQDDSVFYQNKSYKINYTDYQLETTENTRKLSDWSILGRETVDDLKNTFAEKKKEIEKLSSLSAKDFLALEDLSEERKVTLFKESGENIFQHHYFGLVRYLVVSGYFSESYAYYMNHLYTDALSAKDKHYLKNILEARPQSALAPLDNPEKVFYRLLKNNDLKRFNTLNKMLIEYIVGLEKPQDETKESKETKEARENKESIITEMLLASSDEQLVEYLSDLPENELKHVCNTYLSPILKNLNEKNFEAKKIALKLSEKLATGYLSLNNPNYLKEVNSDANKLKKILEYLTDDLNKFVKVLIANRFPIRIVQVYLYTIGQISDFASMWTNDGYRPIVTYTGKIHLSESRKKIDALSHFKNCYKDDSDKFHSDLQEYNKIREEFANELDTYKYVKHIKTKNGLENNSLQALYENPF